MRFKARGYLRGNLSIHVFDWNNGEISWTPTLKHYTESKIADLKYAGRLVGWPTGPFYGPSDLKNPDAFMCLMRDHVFHRIIDVEVIDGDFKGMSGIPEGAIA